MPAPYWEETARAMQTVIESASRHLNFTATNATLSSKSLLGILVASSTAGTIKVADDTGTIVNTMSVDAGRYYPIPCRTKGVTTITVGGTLDATLFFED